MPYENYSVVDCDGHIVESVPEMARCLRFRVQSLASCVDTRLQTRDEARL